MLAQNLSQTKAIAMGCTHKAIPQNNIGATLYGTADILSELNAAGHFDDEYLIVKMTVKHCQNCGAGTQTTSHDFNLEGPDVCPDCYKNYIRYN
jgi:hypothetical protein